jgi:hypothetical protein
MRPIQDQPALVIVEFCSSWPSWDAHPALAPVVVQQDAAESGEQLVERAIARTIRLGTAPELALIVCNERVDASALAARARLITRLVRDMGVASVMLATSDRSSGTARRALAELASDCNSQLETERVRVRFGPALSIPPRVAA